MSRRDEITKILDEVAEGTLCVMDGTDALLTSEEARIKPIREVWEQLKDLEFIKEIMEITEESNPPLWVKGHQIMWQAIKAVCDES